ncbi:uncharacterized protein MYCFIDRAFT_208781 [Pseudocercospora fijiensis CIRAD86]|uniref:Uncharacterized protein n=1 Tax=Pseudocercospora fijiensis (strain CIRAD86) TaxID=383855 RepID=M3AQP9_PSEFD|nr:uncharacterized protein MYCFIDRAFT_208781 [Pseudocercospora fijiensis CIRAD86]EME79418.1 hypothetical protein MYCFIDRAFT_208781 [Pseudocercospora fijiensis CIRAD86]
MKGWQRKVSILTCDHKTPCIRLCVAVGSAEHSFPPPPPVDLLRSTPHHDSGVSENKWKAAPTILVDEAGPDNGIASSPRKSTEVEDPETFRLASRRYFASGEGAKTNVTSNWLSGFRAWHVQHNMFGPMCGDRGASVKTASLILSIHITQYSQLAPDVTTQNVNYTSNQAIDSDSEASIKSPSRPTPAPGALKPSPATNPRTKSKSSAPKNPTAASLRKVGPAPSNAQKSGNWVNRTVQNSVAGVGNYAGAFITSIGNSVNKVGEGIGNQISNTTRYWGQGVAGYGNDIKDGVGVGGPRVATAGNPLGLAGQGSAKAGPTKKIEGTARRSAGGIRSEDVEIGRMENERMSVPTDELRDFDMESRDACPLYFGAVCHDHFSRWHVTLWIEHIAGKAKERPILIKSTPVLSAAIFHVSSHSIESTVASSSWLRRVKSTSDSMPLSFLSIKCSLGPIAHCIPYSPSFNAVKSLLQDFRYGSC